MISVAWHVIGTLVVWLMGIAMVDNWVEIGPIDRLRGKPYGRYMFLRYDTGRAIKIGITLAAIVALEYVRGT